ncbi:MAG: hypothetical protein FJX56_07715 [Alphaproteobacteria bacterium]|nr:hypothetical protein [Alphaproteobacteria bacterium]
MAGVLKIVLLVVALGAVLLVIRAIGRRGSAAVSPPAPQRSRKGAEGERAVENMRECPVCHTFVTGKQTCGRADCPL